MPKSKATKKPVSDYTFKDLDLDLMQLNDLLTLSNVKPCNRLALLSPITSKIPAKPGSYWLIPTVALMMTTLLLWMNWATLDWHISALSRMVLIKTLPYFDWRYLKSQTCLVPKTSLMSAEEIFDCNLCESFGGFSDFILQGGEATQDMVEKLIEIDHPVVLPGEIEHWLRETPEGFISQLLDKEEFAKSMPCQLESSFHNERLGDIDLETLFRKKQLFNKKFFMHFQNCDLAAIRVFRNFTYRPSILPPGLSPIAYNWLLWNSHYNSSRFRKINLIEKVALIGQLHGNTGLRLIPRKNCQNVCSILEGVLPAGHVLIVTSLWDLEYRPGGGASDNMAAVLEIKG